MQTCTRCHTQSQDDVVICPTCQADLREFSETAVALKGFQANSRVSGVRIQAYDDACPACREFFRSYPKDQVPPLPVPGCSHENGCRCFYAPILNEIFP